MEIIPLGPTEDGKYCVDGSCFTAGEWRLISTDTNELPEARAVAAMVVGFYIEPHEASLRGGASRRSGKAA